MKSRVIIFLVGAAILLAVLVPLIFIAPLLFLVAPTLLAALRNTSNLSIARPLSLRNLPLFRAPPAARV